VAGTARLTNKLIFVAICAATPLTFAQEPGTCPDAGGLFAAYDVVSVKPVHPDAVRSTAVFHHPDGIDGESVTVEMVVRSSYAYTFGTGTGGFVNEDVISGLPAWAKTDYFSLRAKMSPEQVAAFTKLDTGQQRACQDNMEQAMVADRFKLKIHREPRQVPAYELVVAKGGPRLKESPGPDDPNAPKSPDGKPLTEGSLQILPAKGGVKLVMQAYSMEVLASLLTNYSYLGVGHSVVDKTGLTGRYSFTLTFTPSQGMGPAGGPDAGASDPGSSIFTALEEQLGLRLQRTTATFNTVVVDHVERPAED
jgi:uncharacterized protein (TIGR03435 family)